MSIDTCSQCSNQIDTDYDSDCYCSGGCCKAFCGRCRDLDGDQEVVNICDKCDNYVCKDCSTVFEADEGIHENDKIICKECNK